MARRLQFLTFHWLKPHQFVVIFGVVASLSVIVAYIVAVSLKDVNALFPYISDTGAKVPESCIFGLLLNCAAIFVAITFFIRHRHVAEFVVLENQHFANVNDVSLFLGYAVSFGIMLVANFQETSVLAVHLVGAMITFVCMVIYGWLQCYITYKCLGFPTITKCCFYLRMVLASIATVAFITTFIGSAVASMEFGKMDIKEDFHWDSSVPGYAFHLLSTFSEWIMVIASFLFLFSFYVDFKQFELSINADRVTWQLMEDAPLDGPILS